MELGGSPVALSGTGTLGSYFRVCGVVHTAWNLWLRPLSLGHRSGDKGQGSG